MNFDYTGEEKSTLPLLFGSESCVRVIKISHCSANRMKDFFSRKLSEICLKKKDVRGMAGKLVDTISIFNRKRNLVTMNISGFAKIFHEQIDEIL